MICPEQPPWLDHCIAPVADEEDLSTGREIETRCPLLFLLAPRLARLEWDRLVKAAGYPSTTEILATSRLRALLALKLLNRSRRSHTQGLEHDRGVGLFAGLNVLPKATTLHDYRYRTGSAPHRALLNGVMQARLEQESYPTDSFELDFHAIRHHGEEPSLEKHYVPKRSQRTQSVLTSFEHSDSRRPLWVHAGHAWPSFRRSLGSAGPSITSTVT